MAYDEHQLKKHFQNFHLGQNTEEEPQKIDDAASPDLLNIQPIGRGAYAPRFGISRIGDKLETVGTIKSLYTFQKKTGEILIRSHTTKLQYLNGSSIWTDVPAPNTYTTDLEFGFANDQDYVYGGNGIDDFFVWDGNTHVSQTFTADAGTDVITATAHGLLAGARISFKNTGGALPGGLAVNTFYYVRDVTTDTFKVSATEAGSAIDITTAGTGTHSFTQGPITFSGNPKGTIFTFFLKRLCVAGIPTAKTTVYYSKTGIPTDFTFSGPRVPDDGGFFQVGDGGDDITSLQVFRLPTSGDQALFVFKKSTRVYAVTFEDDGTPNIQEIKRDTGAINHRSTLVVENDILFVDPGNNIANMGYRENIADDIRTDSTTMSIDRTTNGYTFESACAVYSQKRQFALYCLKDYGASANNTVLAYFYKYKSWWRWKGINANQFAIYNGEICWASSTDMNVYKYDENRFDDNGAPILSYRSTKDVEGDSDLGIYSDRYKQTRFVIVRGYISPNAEMLIKTRYDGNPQNDVISSFSGGNENIVTENTTVAFGTQVFGRAIFGGGAALSPTDFPLFPFLAIISLDAYSFLDERIITEVQEEGAPYLITFIGIWNTLLDEEKFLSESKI